MGSFDSAKITDLVGVYIFIKYSKQNTEFKPNTIKLR